MATIRCSAIARHVFVFCPRAMQKLRILNNNNPQTTLITTAVESSSKYKTGIINFVMPGKQSVVQILETYTNKTLKELNKEIKISNRETTELLSKF